MQTPLGAIVGISLILFMVVFLLHFSIASLSVIDVDVNSTYSDQFNATTDTAKASFALMQFMPLLLIVGALIFTMVFFTQLGRRR